MKIKSKWKFVIYLRIFEFNQISSNKKMFVKLNSAQRMKYKLYLNNRFWFILLINIWVILIINLKICFLKHQKL